MERPQLIEPITKLYLNQVLKKVHDINNAHFNIIFNITLFLTFVFITSIILYYRYRQKQNRGDFEEEKERKREELLDLIFYYQQEAKRKHNNIFTELPIWKNEFEPIEKCF
jgi:hypothetical protein